MSLRAFRLLRSWWHDLRRPSKPNRRAASARLRVEALEPRLVPSTMTVVAEADARVERGNPTQNYGADTQLVSDHSPERETLMRFDLQGVTGPVQSAKVRVYVTDGSVNGPAIYAAANDWTESGVTWNNRPARLGGSLDDKGRVVTGWLEFDVTSAVSAKGKFSFVLSSTSTDGLYMASRERGGFAPQLVITIGDGSTVPPPPPPAPSPSGVGQSWSTPTQVGTVDSNFVAEASGLAVSRAFPNRIYQINDSGDGGYFYVSDMQGQNTQRIEIAGFRPSDTEDLAYGTVNGKNYLIIGDIGDNARSRGSITLVFIEEQAVFGGSVNPAFKVTVKYPDGAHNAEAMALYPNGDIYIMTKENPSRVYRLAASQWQNAGSQTQTLQYVGQFSLAIQTGSTNITSMDISPDGRRVLILTYSGAMELETRLTNGVLDFSQYGTNGGPAYKTIKLTKLPQQESISYLPNGKDFLYTSERVGNELVPIYEVVRLT